MFRALLVLTLCFLFLACGEGHHDGAAGDAPLPVGADAVAKMEAADHFDGTADHVVSKCPSCALQMDGKPNFGIKLGDYTMQFCSEPCRKNYTKDPEGMLALLKIPEATAAE